MSTFNKPLADRLRPLKLEDFLGQEEIVGENKLLREAIENDNIPSMIFWGPPGTGKTTLALIIAQKTNSEFIKISAVSSGLKDLREIIEKAEINHRLGKKTILFIDEIHRWNKTQQDALLPHIESGLIILIGATTENPSFEVQGALLSRVRVFVFKQLDDKSMEKIIKRGMKSISVRANRKSIDFLISISNGDARVALNILEYASTQSKEIDIDIIKEAAQKTSLIYDKNGEEHYNIISALHKSMRGSDANASLYWLARLVEGGEDPLYIARRIIRFAAEDIGLANSRALDLAVNVYNACHYIGYPDGLPMTYQWSCNGGSLSNSTTLQPTFYAPNVSSTQTYSCTLTARDTNNKTASSVVYITVNPVAPKNPPIVSAGPNKTITSGQSTVLNGTASHPDGLPMTYQWSCNGGRLSNLTTLQPTFYAPSVSSTQTYSCTLTARDTNNKTASSVTYITVNPIAVSKPNVFNSNPADNPLRVGNSTQNQGTQNWQTSLTGVNAGDVLEFSVYFHNASDIPATNTNVRLQLSPAGSSTFFTATSTISATNFSDYTTSASIALTSSQSIQLSNTAKLYSNYDGNNYQITNIPVSVSGNVLTYNLGTVNPGYAPNDGYIIFYGQVSNVTTPKNPPIVSAGPNKTITSGQSTVLNGTASHPDGLPMTYQWSSHQPKHHSFDRI
jgi:putative ATPase